MSETTAVFENVATSDLIGVAASEIPVWIDRTIRREAYRGPRDVTVPMSLHEYLLETIEQFGCSNPGLRSLVVHLLVEGKVRVRTADGWERISLVTPQQHRLLEVDAHAVYNRFVDDFDRQPAGELQKSGGQTPETLR